MSEHDQPWNLVDSVAQLTHHGIDARFQLSKPDRGLQAVRLSSSVEGAQLIESEAIGSILDSAAALDQLPALDQLWALETNWAVPQDCAESYVRQPDLFARYAPENKDEISTSIYWRSSVYKSGDIALPQLELILSLQTERLDTKPEVGLRSTTARPLEKILIQSPHDTWSPLGDSRADSTVFDQSGSNGLIVLRFRDAQYSICLALHPSDHRGIAKSSHQTASTVERSGSDTVSIVQSVSLAPLEKGVIRRVHARMCAVARSNDCDAAADWFADFATVAPPLTT